MLPGFIWQKSSVTEPETWCCCAGHIPKFEVVGPRSEAVRVFKAMGIGEIEFANPGQAQPGSRITWQQAQERYEKGLPVETLRLETRPEKGWVSIADTYCGRDWIPADRPDYTYRIPPQPVVTDDQSNLTKGLLAACDLHRQENQELKGRVENLKEVVDFKNRKIRELEEQSRSHLVNGHTAEHWHTCYLGEQAAAKQVIEARDRKILELEDRPHSIGWTQANAWHHWAGELLDMSPDEIKHTAAGVKQTRIAAKVQELAALQKTLVKIKILL